MLDLPVLSVCFMIIFIQFVIDVQIEGFLYPKSPLDEKDRIFIQIIRLLLNT